MQDQNNERERLTALETTQKFILAELKNIKDNHLRTIHEKVDRIESTLNARPSWLISILLTGMSSIIVAFIVYSVTKGG